MGKFRGFVKTLATLCATVVGVGAASVTTAVTQGPTTSGSYDYVKYEESVSATAMMHLASEASQGVLLEMYTRYMELQNNTVSGWTHIKQKTFDNNMSYALWVNQYDPTTYALIYAGTDHIEDTLDYIPMEISEDRSPQIKTAIEIAKGIDTTIDQKHTENSTKYGKLNKLYVCGHSLGGYLSMYVTSDLVDCALGKSNTLITLEDIGYSNSIALTALKDKLQCVTFGAPGMYYDPLPIISNTNWQKQKAEIHEMGLYDDIITQHVNSRDPVGNLFQYENFDKFEHLGTKVYYEVKKANFITLTKFFFQNLNIIGAGIAYTPIYYHMPWIYVNAINNK